jgi:hypothetical protein
MEKKDTAEHIRLRDRSHILTGQNQWNVHSVILWDPQTTEYERLKLIGNEKGLYFYHGDWHLAFLPFVRQRKEELNQDFKRIQQQAKNLGKEAITVMPQEMADKLDNLIAQEDVLLEEVAALNTKLKEFSEKVEKEDTSKILLYGLKLSGKFHGLRAAPEMMNVLCELDGQRIVQDAEGLLIIDSGPYRGMDVPSYRKLAEKWRKDRLAADKQKLLRLQAEAKEAGRPIPNLLPSTSRKVDPRNLPAWPEWAVNHYAKINHD